MSRIFREHDGEIYWFDTEQDADMFDDLMALSLKLKNEDFESPSDMLMTRVRVAELTGMVLYDIKPRVVIKNKDGIAIYDNTRLN